MKIRGKQLSTWNILKQMQTSWQKMFISALTCATRCTWSDFGLWSCHHLRLDCPRSPHFHLPKLLQKNCLCNRSAEHSAADLGLQSCHHHSLDCPMPPRFHLPKWQKKRSLRHKSAEHSWAGAELWSCHRHCVGCPMSRRFHLPE